MTTDLHHLAAAYALDALDPAERAEFEAHYPGCETCRVEVLDFRETASRLAVDPLAPPLSIREAVMAEIAQTRQLSPREPATVVDLAARRRERRAPVVLGAIAAVAILLAGFFAFSDRDESRAGSDLVELLASPDISVEVLEGDMGTLSVAWSADLSRLAVLGSDLPSLDADLVYALWLLDDNGAKPAALFRPGDAGLVQEIGDLPGGDPSGWGVTIEPSGGSPQPTGDILYVTDA